MAVSNQGKSLQNQISMICEHYAERGIAKIHKVDPPVRVVGTGRRRKTIFLANPFLDFVGAWTDPVSRYAPGLIDPSHLAGRLVTLEAKSTEDQRLEIGQGGISDAQFAAMKSWKEAGALVGVLWGHAGTIRLVPLELLQVTLMEGRKSVKWHEALMIQPGLGKCTHDFLATLAAWHGFGPE